MGTGEINAGDNPVMEWRGGKGEGEILLDASCYRKRDKLRPDGPLGSYPDFTYTKVFSLLLRSLVPRERILILFAGARNQIGRPLRFFQGLWASFSCPSVTSCLAFDVLGFL